MRILSLDPGGTTGWALWQGGPFALMQSPTRGIKLGQIGPHEHYLELKEFIEGEHTRDLLVVYESFQYRQAGPDRTTVNLISCEYIGILKLLRDERGLRIHDQTSGEGRGGFWGPKNGGDDKIKKLGLWWPGNKHAMDALRHLLYYVTNGPDMVLRVEHGHQILQGLK